MGHSAVSMNDKGLRKVCTGPCISTAPGMKGKRAGAEVREEPRERNSGAAPHGV